jgi:hypothetical protein
MRIIATIAGLILFTAVMGWVGNGDVEEAERQLETYCEMVQIWHDTNGESGWPPYEGEDQC